MDEKDVEQANALLEMMLSKPGFREWLETTDFSHCIASAKVDEQQQ